MKRFTIALSAAAMALGAMACDNVLEDPSLEGEIPFEPQRPSVPTSQTVDPYTGSNPLVMEAQDVIRTGNDLHAKVIWRTCTPNGGVCHNRKEYPDLHTPANFLSIIGSPCNVQSGTPEAVYDRCERPGDRFRLGDTKEVEIGWFEYVPGEYDQDADGAPNAETAGLHLYLADPVNTDREEWWTDGTFIRSFVNPDTGLVEDLGFAQFRTRWWILDGGTHVMAEVRSYQTDTVEELLAVGIVKGDANKNGIFGARNGTPVKLVEPGNPEASYLVARLRGFMGVEEIPGSRMPLANQPLSIPEMLALFCFIEGLDPTGAAPNLNDPIDYAGCSYSVDPESLNLLGQGVTFETRIHKLLMANCGGCHSETVAQAGFGLTGDYAVDYDRLLEASSQTPSMPLISAGAPLQSYLYLKLIGDPSITGSQMPLNPLNGAGKLPDNQIQEIYDWIEAGAVLSE